MGIRILIIGFFVVGIIACKEDKITLDYCKMISEDQSYVNNDKSDMTRFNTDKAERRKIFKKNFDLIIQKTKQAGFPYVSLSNYQNDSCKYWAVSMTMVHTAQTSPDVFFSKKHADLFKSEMDKGNIEKELLERSSIITAKTIDLCDELKPKIEYALNEWQLDSDIFNKAKFITCD